MLGRNYISSLRLHHCRIRGFHCVKGARLILLYQWIVLKHVCRVLRPCHKQCWAQYHIDCVCLLESSMPYVREDSLVNTTQPEACEETCSMRVAQSQQRFLTFGWIRSDLASYPACRFLPWLVRDATKLVSPIADTEDSREMTMWFETI